MYNREYYHMMVVFRRIVPVSSADFSPLEPTNSSLKTGGFSSDAKTKASQIWDASPALNGSVRRSDRQVLGDHLAVFVAADVRTDVHLGWLAVFE